MNVGGTLQMNNGRAIPQLGLGAWKPRGDEARQSILWALEAGYRLIDTAAFYHNEREVGQAVRESGLAREEIFVTTKLWNADQTDGRQLQAFEDSLDRLGFDYVDLYLLHWPVPGKYRESWKVLEAIYASGRAKAIGVSNFMPHHLDDLLQDVEVTPALDQVELHPHLAQVPLVEYCRQKGILVQAWRPLGGEAGGLLSDPVIAGIGQKYGKSNAQVLLRWNLQRGICTIPKSSNRQRIRQNTELFDFELSPAEMDALNAMDSGTHYGEDPDRYGEYPKLTSPWN